MACEEYFQPGSGCVLQRIYRSIQVRKRKAVRPLLKSMEKERTGKMAVKEINRCLVDDLYGTIWYTDLVTIQRIMS